MQFTLSLHDSASPDESLQELTREVCLTLNRETPAEAEVEEQPATVGSRGDAVTLGAIAITLGLHTAAVLTAHLLQDAAVRILKNLRTFFHRNPALRMEFKMPDGR